MSLLCSAVWLFLLCSAPVCPSTDKQFKCRHDRHNQIHQNTRSTKRFCDPSFSNQVAGAITQKCSSGFYREQIGPYRGQCVPCRCNGLSNECDEQTGNCVNCQFNTAGDHCERCKEGHYGNAADRTCHACPCPSTRSNFALACLDTGSGVVECLCKRGYSGARCERCAFGYYGNPVAYGGSCKPCNCKDNTLNICNSLTGECITAADSSCRDHCHIDCDSCSLSLLPDLEQMDDALSLLKQQMQKITNGPISFNRLNRLQANMSETKILVGSYGTAVRHLGSKVEPLEADVDVVRDDFSQLIDKGLKTESDLENVWKKVNGTESKAEDLLTGAETLQTAIQDLIKRRTEAKPEAPVSENNKARMMEEAQRVVQEMRERSCSVQRDKAGREQEEAHASPVKTSPTVLNQTANSLMESNSSLRDVAELLSEAQDAVDRTQGLNLKSLTTLQHLEHLHTQLKEEQNTLPPLTEMTKDLQKNMTDIFLMLEEIKKDFENQAAQLDGARLQLTKKLNTVFKSMTKVDVVTKAEERAEELSRVAAELHQMLHNATNSTELLSALGIGAHNDIMTVIEKALMAANLSREAADRALKDAEEGGLVSRAEGLKENSTGLLAEATKTQRDLQSLSHTVNAHTGRVNKQTEKGEKLRMSLSAISDDVKSIKRDDTEVLIESAKTAASSSNSTVSNITERLRNISQEVERITLNSVTVNTDAVLIDAERAVKNLKEGLPSLKDNIKQVEALSRKVPPSTNMTESIRRIKDVIEETRNYVNRLSVATTFNGKGHVELHPPRNLEDIKAFTAVDLLLNRHKKKPSKADNRRRRRQDKRRDASFFVLYLGDNDASGDYIGMAIRSNVLICVYKLGGIVHEVETGQITTTTDVTSSVFDRVVFHRVYQDAEVNVTQKFTSQEPVGLSPKRILPDTKSGILQLEPNRTVFYVGGYPDDFKPPVELQYPKYRGAMKLSYINDNPVCLFNYKRAVNLDAKQLSVKIPTSDFVSYYDGTGYRMALIKKPHKRKFVLKFHTNSRETNTLLFYTGNEESFLCVLVERGFLVLQGQQAGRKLRLQSAERVSLFDTQFAVVIADRFTVYYGRKNISTDHKQKNHMSYYIGGLPASLRQRHNITAPAFRGCVDHLTADAEIVEYNRTLGVSDGCPVSLLGVRSATLSSALSVDPLFIRSEHPLRVSLGFRSTDKHGTLLRSSSQGSTSVVDLQLSLEDGYAVFNSDNYTVRSDKRYSDGSWHYLSAVRRPTGLELSIDNVKVVQGRSPHKKPLHQNLKGENFTGCIANLYTRRPEQTFIPVDLSSFSLTEDVVLGQCSLDPQPHTGVLPAPVQKRPQKNKPILAPEGSQCRPWQAQHGEFQLSEEQSWLRYTVSQEDLNHRPHFSLNVKTKSSKGLILHVAGRGVIPLLALYFANGKIKMSLGQNRIIQHKEKSNDGDWHKVEISVEKSTFHLLVDGFRVTDGHLPNNEGSSLDLRNPVYLGGDPTGRNTKGHSIPVNGVIGCIRDLKMYEEPIGEPDMSHKTSPCSNRLTEMGTYFGGGHIVLDKYFTAGSQFVLSFEMRPQYLTGLLFHVQSHKSSFDLFLKETKVGVKVKDGSGAVSVSVTPAESLCDGKFHLVTVSRQAKLIKLVVDSLSEQKAIPRTSTSSSTRDALYIGGTTQKNRLPVSSPFVGCMRDVKLNGKPVSFEARAKMVGPVNINKCPAY